MWERFYSPSTEAARDPYRTPAPDPRLAYVVHVGNLFEEGVAAGLTPQQAEQYMWDCMSSRSEAFLEGVISGQRWAFFDCWRHR